jgi:hypothetical protein
VAAPIRLALTCGWFGRAAGGMSRSAWSGSHIPSLGLPAKHPGRSGHAVARDLQEGSMPDIGYFRSTIRKYSGREFVENLVDICGEMHSELNVLTFGIILYDESAPEFRKMLRDKDYWEALDKASGNRMVIFTLLDKEEHEAITTMEYLVAGRASSRDRGKSYSYLMKKLFADESLLVYPSVLFFQVVGDEIFGYRLVPLKRVDIWQSMRAVQDLFVSISGVLNNILPENFGNQKEIFNLVKQELLRQKYTLYILDGPKKLSEFIGILKTLLFWL